ncbi:MAG: HAMP domain-containing sensor histidine kinase [Candidatus Eisenbacteria bacterium]
MAKVRVFLRLSFAEEIGQLKSNLITLLAHETRTPLTRVLSSAQLLQGGDFDDSGHTQADLIDIIVRGTQRLNTIFEKSMALFREQATDADPEVLEELDLLMLVRSEAKRVLPLQTTVAIEVTGNPAMVRGNEAALRKAIGILLDQALERSSGSQSVVVEVSSREGHALLDVLDRGPAPHATDLSQIFELFTTPEIQHHSTEADLDRPICSAIIRRHGGSVIACLPHGGGLLCQVSLPLADGQELRDVS